MKTRRVATYLACAVGLVCLVLAVGQCSTRRIILRASLPTGDIIQYGYRAYWARGSFLYFVAWRRKGLGGLLRRAKVYFVYDAAEPRMYANVEMRATRDYRGVWIVHRGLKEEVIPEWPDLAVVASLDLATGEFLSINRVPEDWRLPLTTQAAREPMLIGQKPHPSWATPNGGILLASAK